MMHRKSDYGVVPLILNRWSPRAMSGEIIDHDQLMKLFEAARWAPSSYNSQLWRFIYARRGTQEFQKMFDLLVPFNQSWAHRASHLIIIISRKRFTYNDQPAVTHAFDAGAAWQNLALQGFADGLVIHGIEGFDYKRARKEFFIPDDYEIHVIAAIGKPGSIEDLPPELREREALSDRVPLQNIVFEGTFKP